MVLDPAVQLSLNGPASQRRRPNEKLARELRDHLLPIGGQSPARLAETGNWRMAQCACAPWLLVVYLQGLEGTLSEWSSAADEQAFAQL
jgi:hypothetical protein